MDLAVLNQFVFIESKLGSGLNSYQFWATVFWTAFRGDFSYKRKLKNIGGSYFDSHSDPFLKACFFHKLESLINYSFSFQIIVRAIRKRNSPVTTANVSQFCGNAILTTIVVTTVTSQPTYAEIKIAQQVCI